MMWPLQSRAFAGSWVPRKVRFLIAVALVMTFAAAVYGPSLGHEFQYDDLAKIAWTNWRRDPVEFLRGFVSGGYSEGASRLLPNLTLALDYAWFGLDPFAYNATNLLVHLLNVALVAAFGRALLRRAGATDDAVALLGAAIFALHPLNTEAVNYCNARPNTMATAFYLGALLAALHAACAARLCTRVLAWIASAVAAFAALLCKEIAVTLAAAMPLLLWWFPKRAEGTSHAHDSRWEVLGTFAGLAFVAVAVSIMTGALPAAYGALLESDARATGSRAMRLVLTLVGQSEVFLRYFGLALVPWPGFLSIDHGTLLDLPARMFRDGRAVQGALVRAILPLTSLGILLAVLRAALSWRHRAPLATYLVLWPFVTCAVNFLLPRDEPMVEYRTYLPMVGICVGFALGLRALALRLRASRTWAPRIRAAPAAAAALLLLALAAGTIVRNRAWATSETMWRDVVQKSPGNPRAHNNLGGALTQLGRHDEALAAYRRAVALDPDFPEADLNVGVALAQRGDVDGALHHYARAVRMAPDRPEAALLLGKALVAKGRVAEAVVSFRRSLFLSPADAETHFELGKALSYRGDYAGAIRELERAVALDPAQDDARAYLEALRDAPAVP